MRFLGAENCWIWKMFRWMQFFSQQITGVLVKWCLNVLVWCKTSGVGGVEASATDGAVWREVDEQGVSGWVNWSWEVPTTHSGQDRWQGGGTWKWKVMTTPSRNTSFTKTLQIIGLLSVPDQYLNQNKLGFKKKKWAKKGRNGWMDLRDQGSNGEKRQKGTKEWKKSKLKKKKDRI